VETNKEGTGRKTFGKWKVHAHPLCLLPQKKWKQTPGRRKLPFFSADFL